MSTEPFSHVFPPNPEDGMLFECSPGVFFEYRASTRSWVQVTQPSVPLATPFRDGLMSAEDFNKMTGILIPPPKATLTAEGCTQTYTDGLVALVGDDDGIINIEPEEENLHENTAAINFSLDIEQFVQKLIDLDKLRFTAPAGDIGPTGDAGDDGANGLPTGPQGDDGVDGANAEWDGILTEEAFEIAHDGRAIVDIRDERVSPEENYLVVRRANIGNPGACPDTIVPLDIQSPWLISISNIADVGTSVEQTVVNGELTCSYSCNSSIFYFDIDVIIQGIRDQWVSYLNKVKAEKEAIADEWLAAIIKLFNEQKSALCCALEACRSRERNVATRQYIEAQRIQAAAGGFKLLIGSDDDKIYPPSDPQLGPCAWNIAPSNFNLLRLSDPNCKIDWAKICPQGNTGGGEEDPPEQEPDPPKVTPGPTFIGFMDEDVGGDYAAKQAAQAAAVLEYTELPNSVGGREALMEITPNGPNGRTLGYPTAKKFKILGPIDRSDTVSIVAALKQFIDARNGNKAPTELYLYIDASGSLRGDIDDAINTISTFYANKGTRITIRNVPFGGFIEETLLPPMLADLKSVNGL